MPVSVSCEKYINHKLFEMKEMKFGSIAKKIFNILKNTLIPSHLGLLRVTFSQPYSLKVFTLD